MTGDKITIRQVFAMYILTTLSPAIRLFPSVCARYGKTAGWLAPIAGAAVPVLIVLVLSAIYKSRDYGSLSAVFKDTFGAVLCKILLAVYLIWTLLLFSVYIRYYAELLVSSLFTETLPEFFVLAMLALVYYATRAKLAALARFSELSILVFGAAFAIFFMSLLPTLKLQNVLPVTYYDAVPLMRPAYTVAGIWGYITPLFFLGGHFVNKDEIRKQGLKTVLIVMCASVLMVFTVVGSLGPDAAARMPLPFFKVSKLIDIMQSFDRFEAIVTSVWMIADFVLLTVLVFVITQIAGELFGTGKPRHLAVPVILLGIAGSYLISSDRHGLEQISASYAAQTMSIALCLGLPVLALAVMKARQRFNTNLN